LRDNTVVVFTSDHGLHLGDRGGVYDKRTLWERATRVPLIVSSPGRKSSGEVAGLVELVDLYPTLCELCGIASPDGLEGTSFVPLLDNPRRAWKKAAFMNSPVAPPGRAVRTERYRYVEWNNGPPLMLYDHQSDPDENINLAGDPKHAGTVAELARVLKAGWQAAGPPGE
jgi:arylsulfatase A-like enzyme